MSRLSAILYIAVVAIVGLIHRAEAQNLTTLYAFTGSTDGAVPGNGVIMDSAGRPALSLRTLRP